jgi:hypothetical protein
MNHILTKRISDRPVVVRLQGSAVRYGKRSHKLWPISLVHLREMGLFFTQKLSRWV